nr:MAG TPA: hypothetical protein [Caudoviricetes sp.]
MRTTGDCWRNGRASHDFPFRLYCKRMLYMYICLVSLISTVSEAVKISRHIAYK